MARPHRFASRSSALSRRLAAGGVACAAAVGGLQVVVLDAAGADVADRQRPTKASVMARAQAGLLTPTGSGQRGDYRNAPSRRTVTGPSASSGPSAPTPAAATPSTAAVNARSAAAAAAASMSASPLVFNPRRGSTTFTVEADQADRAAQLEVFGSDGAKVRRLPEGLQAGSNLQVWDGKDDVGVVVPDDTYNLRVTSVPNGPFPRAYTGVDTVAPQLTSPTARTGVYPYPDGFVDTTSPSVTISEKSVLILTVYTTTPTKRAVRIFSATRGPGRVALTWNGRTGSGATVPAGTYTYTYSAYDAARNTSNTVGRQILVSARRLVTKTTVLRQSAYNGFDATNEASACAAANPDVSDYPSGVYLLNGCDSQEPDTEAAQLGHFWTLPAAYRLNYTVLKAYGRSTFRPAYLTDAVYSFRDGRFYYDDRKQVVTTPGGRYVTFHGTPLAGTSYYSAARRMITVVALPNIRPQSDFDTAFVLLYVNYTVLQ